MMPKGALITIWHLLIILTHTPRAWLKSMTVLAVVTYATIPFGIARMVLAYEQSGLPAKLSETVADCGVPDDNIPEHPVILRIDDVQSTAWRDVAIQMIDDAIARQYVTSLGVIPYKLETDLELVNKLRARSCYLDITLHGYLHLEDAPEFLPLNYSESTQRMHHGLSQLKMITTKPITVFIPPGNKLSDDARRAAHDLSMSVAAEGTHYLDYDASSYDFLHQTAHDATTVMEQCQRSWAEEEKCIIMLHPQDFASNGQRDDTKYQHYIDLLNELKTQNIPATTLSKLAQRHHD